MAKANSKFKSFSNLAISLDGKIADPSEPEKMLGTAYDRKMMQVIRAKADVVIFGASTLKASKVPVKIKTSSKRPQIVNAVISASGNLPKGIPFWNDPKVIRFVFTTAKGYAKAVESSGGRAFVVTCGEDCIDPKRVISRLLESGLTKILVEGGGETMELFLKEKLLQELYVTLTPRILGGRTSPTLVGGDKVIKPWPALKLLSSKRAGEEIYLNYQVKGSKTSV